MKLEIPLSEISFLLARYTSCPIELNNPNPNQLHLHYIISADIYIKEVRDYSITFSYNLHPFLNFLAKVAKFFADSRMDKDTFSWDTQKKELKVNVMFIPSLKEFLKIYRIGALSIEQEKLFIELIQG